MVKQVKLENKGMPLEASLRESVLCYTIMSAIYSSCSVLSEKIQVLGSIVANTIDLERRREMNGT